MPNYFKQASNDNTTHDIGMQPGEGEAQPADEGHGVHPGIGCIHVLYKTHYGLVQLNIFNCNWCIN